MHLLRQTVKRRRRIRHTRQLLGRWHYPIKEHSPRRIEDMIEGFHARVHEVLGDDGEGGCASAAHPCVGALWIDVLDDHRDAKRP
jgi:hypothetical protein